MDVAAREGFRAMTVNIGQLSSFTEPQPIRALSRIYTNYTQVIARSDAGIATVADMAGKRVSTGSPNSGTEVIALRLLQAANLDPDTGVARQALSLPETVDPKTTPPRIAQQAQAVADILKTDDDWTQYVTGLVNASTKTDEEKQKALTPAALAVAVETHKSLLHKSLVSMSPLYNAVMTEARNRLNLLPPSAAMAGVYTMVDNSRGVWKAPANVSLNGVVSPQVSISHEDQEDLNVTTQGKSINAIRSFIGEGVLVWGARTLDGNSLDWRYINVRRTMIMLEESCRLAAKAMVFEPNVANTWVTIKSMIASFLTGIWKRGGLAGAVPDDAFSVHVGLGETMTPEDILEGVLRVTVLVAISRPAEFIEITFQQQMQKS